MNEKHKNIKVLQILPALETGGVERGTIEIASFLKNKEITNFVASSGGKMVRELDKMGVKHFNLPLNTKNPIKILFNAAKIAKIIRNHQINIVHARSRAPAYSAYLAAKKTNAHFITTYHGTYSFGMFGLKKIYNKIMVKGEKIIAISNFIKDLILKNYKISEDKIKVIHRCVDIEKFSAEKIPNARVIEIARKINIDETKKIILMPARITRWKGHEILIKALKDVKYEDYVCYIAGKVGNKKKYKNFLEKLIIKFDLQGKIKIIDDLEDIYALYKLADLVVCPAIKPEAFGRTAIEAQAMGKIVLASNIGGALETIIEGKTGFLAEAGNPSSFAQVIDKILNLSFEQLQEMSENAIQNVKKNFTVEKMCAKTLDTYLELLD